MADCDLWHSVESGLGGGDGSRGAEGTCGEGFDLFKYKFRVYFCSPKVNLLLFEQFPTLQTATFVVAAAVALEENRVDGAERNARL